MLRYKTKTRPGLVALYDIRPRNRAGPFLQPWSPHGAKMYIVYSILVQTIRCVAKNVYRVKCKCNKLCGRPPQNAPTPCKLTFDLESGVRVTCDVTYLCAKFSLPGPLSSRLRPDVHDRRLMSDAHHRLMPPPWMGA